MRKMSVSHTLADRIELLIREEINMSANIEAFIKELQQKLLELIQNELRYK